MLDFDKQDYSVSELLDQGEGLALHDVNGFRFVIGTLHQQESVMTSEEYKRFQRILFTARFRLQTLFRYDFSKDFYDTATESTVVEVAAVEISQAA